MLITGHDGFIGLNLVPYLQLKKYKLVGVSQKPNNQLKIQQIKKNIQKIYANDVGINNISCIIHLAAVTNVDYCQNEPIECFKTNVLGTQNLLEIARKKDSAFIYVSTSHVYGFPRKLPITEEHSRVPTSIYSGSKIEGELCCESYAKSYGMNVTILRLFSVYGPHGSPHLIIPRIISQLLHSKSVKLGNTYPKRDFIYVNDAVSAIEFVIRTKGFNIYNVGTGKSYSIMEICDTLKKLIGSKAPIISTKKYSRKNEINNIISDSSKLKKLGWKPRINLNNGLKLTLNWYRQQV